MRIDEILVQEGPNDPAIFKAIFTAGGPGSGKTFVVKHSALEAMGFKIVNSDTQFERYLAQANMDSDPETIMSPQGQELRDRAKRVTKSAQGGYMQGRLGLVIDGTGKDYDKIEKQVHLLSMLGYETAMLFVNTNLETAKSRNEKRKRSLPDAIVERMWNDVQDNIGKFQRLFKQNMIIIDNSDGNDVSVDLNASYKQISAWASSPPSTPQAKKWLAANKGKNK